MSHTHDHQQEAGEFSIRKLLFRLILTTIIVGLLVGYSMCVQVSQGYHAVVTRFGDPIRSIDQAGLWWKWPWPIEKADFIDMRRRLFNAPYTATFTKDQRNVVLLTYVVWRVEDPLLYLQSVEGRRSTAEQKLEGLVIDRKNYYLGQYDLKSLVSTIPSDIKAPEIEQAILADVARDARQSFGIQVEQVGIKRVAYPEENMKAIVEQMREERSTVAGRIRAEGEAVASDIRNKAVRATAQTIAKGQQEAGDIQGETQSMVANIWNQALAWDLEFYRFWRSLRALSQLATETTTIVLRTDQPILSVISNPPEPTETKAVEPGSPEEAALPGPVQDPSAPPAEAEETP